MADDSPLTEKQLRFCHEYAADPVTVRAYRLAYPNVAYSTADVEGRRLLEDPRIQAEIAAARVAHQRACRVTAGRTLRALAAVAFADPADLFEEDADGALSPKRLSQVPPATRRAVQAIKVKRRRLKSDKDKTAWEVEEIEFKLADKMSALDKLCKYTGIAKDGAALEELIRALGATGAAAQGGAHPPATPARPGEADGPGLCGPPEPAPDGDEPLHPDE